MGIENIKKSDNLCMSEEEIAGMSLNINDQKFIKRLFDREDEYLAEVLSAHYKKVSELIKEQNRAIEDIKSSIAKINDRIDVIEQRLDEDNVRISLLEKYASWQNTVFRMLFAAAVGISIALALFELLHK